MSLHNVQYWPAQAVVDGCPVPCSPVRPKVDLSFMFHAAVSMLAWAPQGWRAAAKAEPKSMFVARHNFIATICACAF